MSPDRRAPASRAASPFLWLLAAACAAGGEPPPGAGRGLGVVLAKEAQVYVGTASFCSKPATIDADTVAAATPEGKDIEREGVRPGSARHALLRAALHRRVVAACRKAAERTGRDLVVRHGDIADHQGLEVVDLTAEVMQQLQP